MCNSSSFKMEHGLSSHQLRNLTLLTCAGPDAFQQVCQLHSQKKSPAKSGNETETTINKPSNPGYLGFAVWHFSLPPLPGQADRSNPPRPPNQEVSAKRRGRLAKCEVNVEWNGALVGKSQKTNRKHFFSLCFFSFNVFFRLGYLVYF